VAPDSGGIDVEKSSYQQQSQDDIDPPDVRINPWRTPFASVKYPAVSRATIDAGGDGDGGAKKISNLKLWI
jgi:hypothetical protein